MTRADLPLDLEQEVAKQLECSVPSKRAPFKKRPSGGPKKASIITSVIKESVELDLHEGDNDVFGSSDDESSIDLDDLEDAFEHFLYKLDNLVHPWKWVLIANV